MGKREEEEEEVKSVDVASAVKKSALLRSFKCWTEEEDSEELPSEV